MNRNRIVCNATGCARPGDEAITGIVICYQHRDELARAIGALPFNPMKQPVVYYVTWRNTDYVKIGTTSNIRKRMRGLERELPHAKVLALEPGSYYLERKRHAQFRTLAMSIGRERFRWAPAIADLITEIRAEHGWKPAQTASGLPN